MLTREQWVDAARFAGVDVTFSFDGVPLVPSRHGKWRDVVWHPDTDWNDFGPLWRKLDRWEALQPTKCTAEHMDAVIRPLLNTFIDAKLFGTDQELMQSGLLLAAAIGKTMREEG